MKRLFLAATIALLSIGYAVAQRSIVVDSEKIFRSIAEYNTALATLDKEAKEYQASIDAKFANIEKLYNTYTQQKAQLPQSERTRREQEILALERSATTYQESIFGTDGVMMKRRIELIQPIQRRVFAAIEEYAKQSGADIVLDKASNASLLYNSAAADHTQQIISILSK
jgi:outer membrane protein